MTQTHGDSPGTGALSRKVLDFEAELRRLVKAAKAPGFTSADWAPLAQFIAVDEFERVGTWLDSVGRIRHLDVYLQQPR